MVTRGDSGDAEYELEHGGDHDEEEEGVDAALELGDLLVELCEAHFEDGVEGGLGPDGGGRGGVRFAAEYVHDVH